MTHESLGWHSAGLCAATTADSHECRLFEIMIFLFFNFFSKKIIVELKLLLDLYIISGITITILDI